MLFEGAKSGDVLRAEADFGIDGITILSVVAPKEKKRAEPERLEIIGSGRPEGPTVTTQLVGRGGRGPRREDGDRRGGDRPDRPRRDRPPGDGPRRDGPRSDGPPAGRREQRPTGQPAGGGQPPEGETGRPSRRSEVAGPRLDSGEARRAQAPGRGQAGRPSAPAGRTKARKLSAGSAHRNAVLNDLSPEERVVAEQVLRGGIPAVRTALHLERENAVAEGRPVPDTDALVTLAERLLPRLRTAEWHDRAEAAIKAPDDVSLRDLRAVVAGSDAARDDETRGLAATLREALEGRLTQLRTSWVDEIRGHLANGRTIRAVRLAGRPPEPSSRLPADLLDDLAEQASATLSPDTAADLWLAMLEAVAASPVRRTVRPSGLPTTPSPDLDRVARQQSGRVPALATLLGITIPPPPGPRRRLADSPPARVPPPPPPPREPVPPAAEESLPSGESLPSRESPAEDSPAEDSPAPSPERVPAEG